jgi:uncharacterized RDD family membrane protein YckC
MMDEPVKGGWRPVNPWEQVPADGPSEAIRARSGWGDVPGESVDPTACVGRRVAAAFVDMAITTLPFAVWFLTDYLPKLVDEFGGATTTTPFMVDLGQQSKLFAVQLAFGCGLFLYYFLTEKLLLGSPGKLVFGLRVVRNNGNIPITWAQSALRNVLRVLFDSSLIAFVFVLVTKGHRRVGDMAAKTLVIPREWVGHFPEVWPPEGIPPWDSPFRSSWPPGAASPE